MGGIGKSTFREIKSSFGRFLAIFAIIALGVGFFAGLKVTKQGMMATVQDYLDRHAFFDYRLLSTMGFEQEDVDGFAGAQWVEAAEGAVSFDIVYRLEDGKQGVAKTHSVTERLNTLKLMAGRMPQGAQECVADSNLFGESAIGSVIYLSEDNEAEDLEHFAYREYTIVGIVRSPLYIQYERGNTSLGTGRVDGYLYLSGEGFAVDYFTEVYVRFSQEHGLYSEEYADFIDGMDPVWEELVSSAALRRYEDIKGEAKEELAEAEAEFQDKKAKGEQELADAAKNLADAGAELEEGEEALADGRRELEEGRQTLARKRQELADAYKMIEEGLQELEEGERTLAQKEADLAAGEQDLAYGWAKWHESDNALQEARGELDDKKAQLDAGAQQLAAAQAALEAGGEETAAQIVGSLPPDLPEDQKAVAAGLAAGLPAVARGELSLEAYLGQLAQLPDGDPLFGALKQGLSEAAQQLAGGLAQIQTKEQELAAGRAKLEAAEGQLSQGMEELAAGKAQLQKAEGEIGEGLKALEDAARQLTEGRRELEDARTEAAQGEAAIADAQRKLEDAAATIAEKERELAEGKQEYEDGLKEYQTAQKEFQEKIQEGQNELDAAGREIEELQRPKTYVLGRDINVGYVCFESDSNIVEGIANLFPAFFFLVAALVCITTMNRMVEEQRTQIGVLKALGYGNLTVMSKYMAYSGLAALGGCVFGFFLGTWGFPRVIWLCYGIMYNADPIFYVFDWSLATISLTVSLLCSMGTTWLSCRAELSLAAAALMRPKAPKAGKRVVLERIPFLWRRLSFLKKVTVRNIFRYKKRLFMMVLGISGCTALLVTGFGIKDSIADIAAKQFQEIQVYDIGVSLKEDVEEVFLEHLEKLRASGVEEYFCVMEKNMDLVTEAGTKAVWLVAGTAEELPSFWKLRTPEGEDIPYPGPGEAVISKKLAEDYGLKAGDEITLRDEDMRTLSVTVAAVYENYIYNYVHISEETWRGLTGSEPERRTIYLNLAEGPEETGSLAHSLAAELMKLEQVSSVTVNEDTMNRIGTMMSSLNIIVAVVILCAAGLAFIVLYNLTNINITERVREIATVKVLGFYKKETAAYVFRENVLLTLLGMALGLVLGYFLHRVIMNEIKVDLIAFDLWVSPLSYLYSGLLTLVFAWLVNMAMGGKLEGISMTESLKSVD